MRSTLRGWLSDAAEIASARGPGQADLIVRDGRSLLAVEFKRLADAGWLAAAIAQVRAVARRAGRNAVPVIAVPFMGDVGRKLCKDANVSWFDLSGNADISAPGLRIYVEGKENVFKRPGRPSTVFAPKSSRVVRRMLIDPRRSFRQRDLARESVLDEGFTSRIVKKLEADRMVLKDSAGLIRVSEPDLLLDSWRDAYDFSKHQVVAGHISARSGEESLTRIARTFEDKDIAHAATGLAGAWLLTGFAAFRLVTLFVSEEPSPNVLKSMGFRKEARGANVWFVVPNDEGVFAEAKDYHAVKCVHPVQVYMDLKGHPERSAEAAEELRKRFLKWGR